MKEVAILYCSSREANQNTNLQANQTTLITTLDIPITTEHSHEELYVAVKSVTFTNMFYNSLDSFRLRLGIAYISGKNTLPQRFIDVYRLNEGNFDVFGFQTEYESFIKGDRGKTGPTNTLTYTELGMTNAPAGYSSVVPTTFSRIVFNENNRKFILERDTFTLTFLASEVEAAKTACIPNKLLIEIQNDTEEIYDYWGVFRPGDASQYYEGRRFIEIPLPYTTNAIEITNKQYIQFVYPKVSYQCTWPVYLRTVDYIDVICENVQATNYSSRNSQLNISPILTRVPVLSDFGQTQTVQLQLLNYVPVQQNQLSTLRLQLTNNDNLIYMQKGCYLIEISVGLMDMPDIGAMKGSLDNERYAPALTAETYGRQDRLDYAQNLHLSTLQQKVLGKNKRSL